jgi:hypothetical protein
MHKKNNNMAFTPPLSSAPEDPLRVRRCQYCLANGINYKYIIWHPNPNFDPTMPEHKSNRRWLQIDAFALESRQPGDPLIQVVHKTHNTPSTQAEIDFITANYQMLPN